MKFRKDMVAPLLAIVTGQLERYLTQITLAI